MVLVEGVGREACVGGEGGEVHVLKLINHHKHGPFHEEITFK